MSVENPTTKELQDRFGQTSIAKDGEEVTSVWGKKGKIVGEILPIQLTCPTSGISETIGNELVEWEDGTIGGIHKSKLK